MGSHELLSIISAPFILAGRSITFDPNSMTDTVRKFLAVSGIRNDLAGYDVDTGSGRILSHLVDGLGLCLEHYIPHLESGQWQKEVRDLGSCLQFFLNTCCRDPVGRLR